MLGNTAASIVIRLVFGASLSSYTRFTFSSVSTSMQGGRDIFVAQNAAQYFSDYPLVPRYFFYPGHYFIRNLGKGFCVYALWNWLRVTIYRMSQIGVISS